MNMNNEVSEAIKTLSFLVQTYKICISYSLLLTELEDDIGKYIDTYYNKPEIVLLLNRNKALLDLDAKDLGFTGVLSFLKNWNIYKVGYL